MYGLIRNNLSAFVLTFSISTVEQDERQTGYLHTDLNPADMETKSLSGGEKRMQHTMYLLHYIE